MSNNPLIAQKKVGKYEAFPFDEIKLEHFLPAVEFGIKEASTKLEKIKNNPEKPDFRNTCLAMSELSEVLEDAPTVYYNLMSSHSDDEFKALAQQIAPMMSEFSNQIMTDPVLFERIKYVYEHQEEMELTAEEKRLLETQYKSFIRNGALLSDEDKKELKGILIELAQLSPKFMQNVLGSTNSWEKHITAEKRVKGIPANALKAAAQRAKSKGYEKGWLFNLQIPSVLPVLQYCSDRSLREEVSRAYNSRAFNNKFDNQEYVKRISVLRYQKARLLGYETHAEYILEERMAKSPHKVFEFMEGLYEASISAAKKELEELKAFARELDGIEDFKPWDISYYAEKLKQKKFNYDSEELRPYFQMEKAVQGLFAVAEKLYGIKFKEIDDVPKYHPDVQTYEVIDNDGKDKGLLFIDLFPRETKRGGAWMTNYKTQGFSYGKEHKPQISIVANLTPSTPDTPSLLDLNEVTTLFHEFGHALHGLLSDVKISSLASPNVYWDFVELPSQIMENWVKEAEALALFAHHYETGAVIPQELIQKVKKSQKFRAGSNSLRQLMLGYLDLAWHAVDPTGIEDVDAYEKEAVEKTNLLEPIPGGNMSCSYSHIFAGGYSAGYYSYKWAEVLEADAFELFKEKGIFDRETASSFRNNILARGNTADPMELYIKFRGRKPDPHALLRRSGLE